VITGSGIMKITKRYEAEFGAESGKTT